MKTGNSLVVHFIAPTNGAIKKVHFQGSCITSFSFQPLYMQSHYIAPAIWVKDFAKDPSIGSSHSEKNDKEENAPVNLVPDIETISLSSDDDFQPSSRKPKSKPNQTPKRASRARVARTPKRKENKPSSLLSSAKKGRTPKLPDQYRFHKIDEYFQATKRERK